MRETSLNIEFEQPADAQSPKSPIGDDAFRATMLSVLMPIYNERPTLAEIIRRVFQAPIPLSMELVAVDDRSTDGSWELLQELAGLEPRIKPLRLPRNRGKGAALREALSHARGEIAVIQDADLEYDPTNYGKLLVPILDGEADAVFGSRFTGAANGAMSRWNRWGNRFLTRVTNRLAGLELTDMETGAKMVRTDVLRRLDLRSNTFTIEPELTCRLAQAAARIDEIPIAYTGRRYNAGKKIRPRDFIKAVATLLRCGIFDRR
ncbi:MAG TPA: glycosyltransferase family 2 protein [Pirellulales bacterium]|nr:glycosyltransferase family 2 protein [Pirellulales bacterium]